jgi:hypothetical protein
VANNAGKTFNIVIYIPDDPMDAEDAVQVQIQGGTVPDVKRKTFMNSTKTRAQLLTDALTAIRAYLLAQ